MSVRPFPAITEALLTKPYWRESWQVLQSFVRG